MDSINNTPNLSPENKTSSPGWSSTTKLVIGLTIAGLIVAMVFYLRDIIGPLLLAMVLTYLLHPLAAILSRNTRLSWRAAVNIIYLVVLVILLGLSTAASLAIVQQTQSLIRQLQKIIENLPETLVTLSTTVFTIGPFVFNPAQYLDINMLSSQLINIAQPLLGRAGAVVGSIATGAANTATWTLFVLLVSYFTLADSSQVPDAIKFINIPGYSDDIRRMNRETTRIWNAFLRGQVTIILFATIVYTVLWTALGVRYSLALALIAGLARFVPYIGNAVTWIALIAVTLFQTSNYFGLEALPFTVLVIAPSLIIDQIFDSYISPRILGSSLHVNPGAVLVVAIIAANLIGITGLILAAPVLATTQLVGRYIIRKMFDQNPWPDPEKQAADLADRKENQFLRNLRNWWLRRRSANKKDGQE